MQPRTRNLQAGFTLIELIIVVLIVTILAALAMSGYGYAMIKTRRAAAEGCLTETAQNLERWYTTHLTYLNAVVPGCTADVTKYYTVGPAAGSPTTATTYNLEAVPQGTQTKDSCGTLSLDDKARKLPATDCW